MLSNPIQVKLSFNNASSIYGGVAQPNIGQFEVAEILVRQIKLTDQADSVRQTMIASPELFYTYPFIHTQAFESASFPGSLPGSGSCQVQLNSFLNADITGISMWVVRDDYKYPSAQSTPNPWCTDEISDIQVTYNGIVLFNYPAKSYKLTGMATGDQESCGFDTSLVAPGNAGPISSTPYASNICFFDFSRERSDCLPQHMFNVSRLTNQVLLVRFNTQFNANYSYKLYATFSYNAVTKFQNGTSETEM
jgi:hypothetical protein